MPKIEAWWFSASDILPHGDGRKVVIGEKLSVKGPLVLCHNGMHACRTPWQALQYAPGSLLHKVILEGGVKEESDKLCGRSRTAIERRDATNMLRLFARKQALGVLHLWEAKMSVPDIVRHYLETGDPAARSAADSAARSAARSAAESAAESVARNAAWSAAWSAAESVARSAAWSAARSAAESAAGDMLNAMVAELFSKEG